MVAEERVARLKIHTAKQRTAALLRELDRLASKSYSSPGANRLIEFVRLSAERLNLLLNQEEELIHSGILTPWELEVRSHRVTQILPSLLRTLRFVSGSEIDVSPGGQIVQPLRRYFRSILPGSDIILSSKPELNYSIQEIAALLRNVFHGTVLEESCQALPDHLFAINIPSTEFGNILIHAVLSHEVAHGIYARRQIADQVYPKIRIDQEKVRAELERISKATTTAVPPVDDLVARQNATVEVAERITNWTEELSCDVIGIHLFGLAFYFAYMHFLLSFSRLDNASKTHPPIRLRLKFMTKVMNELYPREQLRKEITDVLDEWTSICNIKSSLKAAYNEIAVNIFEDPMNLRVILDGVQNSLGGIACYSAEQLDFDTKAIEPLFLNLIPAGEMGDFSSEVGTEVASILNIGWLVYLTRMNEFRAKLPRSVGTEEGDIIGQLQALILKSFEISEIRFTYNEISNNGPGNGKNSATPAESS